jgi:dipeptidyl-peptidase 4
MMRVRPFVVAALCALPVAITAQDRVKSMPGYDRAQRVTREYSTLVTGGALVATWVDEGRGFQYTLSGKRFRYDVASGRRDEVVADMTPQRGGTTGRGTAGQMAGGAGPDRGRQFDSTLSPDGAYRAAYRDRNLWLIASADGREIPVTTDGSVASRVKYATASWVYGEELSQRTAMWWSPDGGKIAYYRFDEHDVPDYYIALNQTHVQDTLDAEAYPKPGVQNPIVDLFVYDVATRQSKRVDVRSGKPFDNTVVGHYVYHVEWSRDGRELLFFRTNRRQNIMEVAAANPATGAVRVVLREEWPTGWLMAEPRMVFLDDGTRFIWESQRNGWNNFYLHDLAGTLNAPLTTFTSAEVASLVKIDENAGALYYTARDGDNPLKLQLHRVGLDGKNDRRLTDPAFTHTIGGCIPRLGSRPEQPAPSIPCSLSPDGKYFVDVYQTHDSPPATRLADAVTGVTVAELAASDTTKFSELGLKKAEMFTFTAADGATTLRGLMQFPSTFDPAKRYPVLVGVYGGPEFAEFTARETFVGPSALAEYGFLVVNLDSRAIPGLGKRVLDSIYMKLGQTEIDDMAAGVRALASRPYVDMQRIGIFGTSYGGYSSLMEVLRHPELFAAAASSSPPTDWRNYDTIYTERYMWIPQENALGYDAGSAMSYAKNLKGRLLIYYGSADNNVHPANSLQLIKALQDAGKSFDVQVGPDHGHSPVNQDRMMEFFIDVLKP